MRNFDMRVDALASAIATDRAAGREPCAIVATCGTTATTAFDPVAEIAQIARAEELWLHVDAAMAGSAMILPECRGLWDGVEGADSLVVNPHKWLGVSFDCSTYFVRDPQFLVRVMSTNPSYLQTAADGAGEELSRLGRPAGAAHARAEALVRDPRPGRRAACRRACVAISRTRSGWPPKWRTSRTGRLLAPVRLQTLVLRHEPPGLDADAHGRAHAGLGRRTVNESGEAYLTPAVVERALGRAGVLRRRQHRTRTCSRTYGVSCGRTASGQYLQGSISIMTTRDTVRRRMIAASGRSAA